MTPRRRIWISSLLAALLAAPVFAGRSTSVPRLAQEAAPAPNATATQNAGSSIPGLVRWTASPPAAFDRFEPRPDRFSLLNAYLCMYASFLCYPESVTELWKDERPSFEEKVTAVLTDLGMDRVDFLRHRGTDTHGVVASNSRVVLVAFRGTEPAQLKHWFTNSNVVQVSDSVWGQGKVHKGFAAATGKMLEDLRERLASHGKVRGNWVKPVWITGYSLGGALAVLTGYRLKREGIPVQTVYTFGQPSVGDDMFLKQLADPPQFPYFRIVNYRDIVPKLPPRSLLTLHYGHAGDLCLFSREKTLLIDPDEATLRANPNPFTLGDLARLGRWVDGHHPCRYTRLLFDCLPPQERAGLPEPPPLPE